MVHTGYSAVQMVPAYRKRWVDVAWHGCWPCTSHVFTTFTPLSSLSSLLNQGTSMKWVCLLKCREFIQIPPRGQDRKLSVQPLRGPDWWHLMM